MFKKYAVQVLLAMALLFTGINANAIPLELDPGDATLYGTGTGGACDGLDPADADLCDGTGTSSILAWLDANVAGFDSSDELYKSEVGGGDSGPFATPYTTTYSNTSSDPSNALVEYNGDGDPITDAEWLFVKDGNNEPVWYLFDISSWDGMVDIVLTGFWPNGGAISHLSIYGGDDTTRVPEPGTLALLGLGLLGLGVNRRNRRMS